MSGMPVDLGVLKGLCDGLAGAKDIDASLDVLQEALHHLGWKRLVYGWKSPGTMNDALQVPVLTRDFPQNWDRDWSKHSASDPYFDAAFQSRQPVLWSEVQASLSGLKPKQVDCLHYIEDLGLADGLTMPVCVSGRRFAFVTALDFQGNESSSAVSVDSCQIELLKLIAHFFDNHMIGVSANTKEGGVHLSPREKECLLWTAQGKTVDDIALIMSLSPETVKVYVKRVIKKMSASNKTHAVAKAIHLGLVTIN